MGPFSGNPAGVCLLPAAADESWMQSVATEVNQAETAFVLRASDGFDLRWFTPKVEIDLCGHATLAAAHALWEVGWIRQDEEAGFNTASGRLTCVWRDGLIEMDFPSVPVTSDEPMSGIAEAIGAAPVRQGRNKTYCVFEVANAATLRALSPDMGKVIDLPIGGVCVTAASDSPDFDFESRFFAPKLGIPEDHATGSAHCVLAPYWAEKLGKSELRAFQASARGASIGCDVRNDRVVLRGRAVTSLEGTLTC